MANRIINHLPHTEFGASLNLNEEQEKMCKVVYKLSEEYPDRYVFHGLWNPEKDYSDEYVILPIQSTAFDVIPEQAGHEFANIVGSKDDPTIGNNSWIELLSANNIDCKHCATDGKYYNPEDGTAFTTKRDGKPLICDNEKIIGGHVYPGKYNVKPKKEDQETVELIPICSHHNSYSLGKGDGNGKGFFMKLGHNMNILQLKKYLNRNAVDTADSGKN